MLEFECTLRERRRFQFLAPRTASPKKKHGNYHGSYFWQIEGFGQSKWVVCTTIELKTVPPSDLSLDEIATGCVNFLNKPVGKRKKKQLYGKLELHRCHLREDGSIGAILITDTRKNKNFWGQGQTPPRRRR